MSEMTRLPNVADTPLAAAMTVPGAGPIQSVMPQKSPMDAAKAQDLRRQQLLRFARSY